MKTPQRILELLYDRREGYVSIGELAESARVSPGKLPAVLEQLRGGGRR